ncbi:unnamed protein product [Ectocarpus sp. 4 AP-2014]
MVFGVVFCTSSAVCSTTACVYFLCCKHRSTRPPHNCQLSLRRLCVFIFCFGFMCQFCGRSKMDRDAPPDCAHGSCAAARLFNRNFFFCASDLEVVRKPRTTS